MSDELRTPADWKARYDRGDTPWDRGIPHPELVARLERGELSPPRAGARALVPGAGTGHDALALAEAGWRVTAVDFVAQLAATVEEALGPRRGHFVAADALTFRGGPFELIWEHTFFCAIHPKERAAWGRMVRENLAPDGRLEGIVFPADKPRENGGPPHGYTSQDMLEALGEDFELLRATDLPSSLAGRDWLQISASFARG